MKRLDDYVNGVLSGSITVGNEIKLAVNRYLQDKSREDLIFDSQKVKTVIDFIETLEHFTGNFEGKKFILSDWQVFIIANIYGFYWKETKLRRFTSSYLEIGRKNGKTALSAALCLYHLIADGEGSAEVLLAANSKDQAKIAFDIVSKFVKRLDIKGKYLKSFRADVKFPLKDSVLKVLASDDSKLDGFNASFGLIDEYHAAKTSKVRDVIKSSMGMREQPHLCTITTAGFDKSSPCYQLRTVAIEVLNNLKIDDSLFVAIYSIDNSDDWQDSKNWIKANPNLGITVRETFIKEQIQQAINSPSEELGVRTKNLNQWIDSKDTWISDSYVNNVSKNLNFEQFKGEYCFVGVDLASTSDLAAVSFMWEKDGKYYFKTKYYLPSDSVSSNYDKETYKQWKREGYLTLTEGNVIDYDFILNDLLTVNQTSQIFKIGYDKYNATQFVINATNQGLPLEEYSQTIGNFNQPTKELERLILSNQVIIDNNPITRFCFRNVHLKMDYNGNAKPDKSSKRQKIDGVISMLMALGVFLQTPKYSNTIY